MTYEHKAVEFLDERNALTKEKLANLRKLADYLYEKGELLEDFDMGTYNVDYQVKPHALNTENECGTAGCAVGHGPFAGIKALRNEDWVGYFERVFIDDSSSILFDWLFTGSWETIDNSPIGAAKRIYIFLDDHEKIVDVLKEKGYFFDSGYHANGEWYTHLTFDYASLLQNFKRK
ncbi:hypothetical protein Ab1vBOLIVR5_gp147 [Agrobacterium phage OLIVR5]|uniref:Uncharacterized protein n=1 Tax=Agrobacterium phage OLIVR5 TaxID=2723773 RepID=A0A858MZ15_9CAUD|nr:hypothetical protein KNU99_gp254 [Agrobacterium phage OLIVR5]QIW87795.1 hypothetical protein Ab1vBOLIVR5_gp147 [Agrobacterium phage OLIVR5]QIW88060.1 hypothetical protein Ab1vBOLIVR6_gp153 [Agrobacterium phage OLIVR6]